MSREVNRLRGGRADPLLNNNVVSSAEKILIWNRAHYPKSRFGCQVGRAEAEVIAGLLRLFREPALKEIIEIPLARVG